MKKIILSTLIAVVLLLEGCQNGSVNDSSDSQISDNNNQSVTQEESIEDIDPILKEIMQFYYHQETQNKNIINEYTSSFAIKQLEDNKILFRYGGDSVFFDYVLYDTQTNEYIKICPPQKIKAELCLTDMDDIHFIDNLLYFDQSGKQFLSETTTPYSYVFNIATQTIFKSHIPINRHSILLNLGTPVIESGEILKIEKAENIYDNYNIYFRFDKENLGYDHSFPMIEYTYCNDTKKAQFFMKQVSFDKNCGIDKFSDLSGIKDLKIAEEKRGNIIGTSISFIILEDYELYAEVFSIDDPKPLIPYLSIWTKNIDME